MHLYWYFKNPNIVMDVCFTGRCNFFIIVPHYATVLFISAFQLSNFLCNALRNFSYTFRDRLFVVQLLTLPFIQDAFLSKAILCCNNGIIVCWFFFSPGTIQKFSYLHLWLCLVGHELCPYTANVTRLWSFTPSLEIF